jgi:hypothetical protein
MSQVMTEMEFRLWEARQPIRFELVDGRPKRLPEADQGQSRVSRAMGVASRALPHRSAVEAWMSISHASLDGLDPETVAFGSEEGCQAVLRLLVALPNGT